MGVHINYTDVVSSLAKGEWGKTFASQEDAEKELLSDSQALSAFASLELLRRLECLSGSLKGRNTDNRPRIYLDEEAAVFPDVKSGDHLFAYDVTEGGLSEYVVVAKDEKNRCMVVMLDDFNLQFGPRTLIADKKMKTTPEEAMRAGAEEQIEWYEEQLSFAKKLLKALNDNRPLNEFRNGFTEPTYY